MRVRVPYRLPSEKEHLVSRASKLEWISIFLISTIIAVMYFAMGSSQAMKTAWAEDILSLVPPIAILLSYRVRNFIPNERFPYGYRRAGDIAFLVAAVALSGFGAVLLFSAASSLLRAEHPTIGAVEIFGTQLWLGWIMILALLYSIVPVVVLGRLKRPLAEKLHDKALHTDALMNRGDWLTAAVGIVGILGVGIGWWWSDAAAAAIISIEIIKDGFQNLTRATADLMDERPSVINSDRPHPIIEDLERYLNSLEWVSEAEVRLREEGHVFAGEAYVVPLDETNLSGRLERTAEDISRRYWQLYDVVLTASPSRSDQRPQESDADPESPPQTVQRSHPE